MRSGQLKHNLTFQAVTETADGAGGFTESWSNVMTVRGAIWPISARERIENQQVEHEITNRIRVRYRDSMNTKQRIKHHSCFCGCSVEYYNIRSKLNPGRVNERFDLLVEELDE